MHTQVYNSQKNHQLSIFIILAVYNLFLYGAVITADSNVYIITASVFLMLALIPANNLFYQIKISKITLLIYILVLAGLIVWLVMRPPTYKVTVDSDAKAQLHNLYIACKNYWADNGSKNSCTVEIVSQNPDSFVQWPDVSIQGSGSENDFRATASHSLSKNTFSMDSQGIVRKAD